jgi:hypothetical protein
MLSSAVPFVQLILRSSVDYSPQHLDIFLIVLLDILKKCPVPRQKVLEGFTGKMLFGSTCS